MITVTFDGFPDEERLLKVFLDMQRGFTNKSIEGISVDVVSIVVNERSPDWSCVNSACTKRGGHAGECMDERRSEVPLGKQLLRNFYPGGPGMSTFSASVGTQGSC